jgi:hypothetical protein
MPHSISHTIFPLILQLIRILSILRNIPDPISNHPRRIPQLFQETLRLLRALLNWGRSAQSRKTDEDNIRNNTHFLRKQNEIDNVALKCSTSIAIPGCILYSSIAHACARVFGHGYTELDRVRWGCGGGLG